MNTLRERLGWSEYAYFQWLIEKVHGYEPRFADYSNLLDFLYLTDYRCHKCKDGDDHDRYRDGLALRERFRKVSNNQSFLFSPEKKCSVLEMLIALAEKCDRDIMGIPLESNGWKWFWEMLDNLGLYKQTDSNFSQYDVQHTLDIWMDRQYDSYGNGGIFPSIDSHTDQRTISTWLQLMMYINDRYYGRDV